MEIVNAAPVRRDGDYVIYWMIASRRVRWNFALQRAVEWGTELKKPVIVFEPLRLGYHWASARIHRFIIDGMADNARALQKSSLSYYPYVEPASDAGKGLLAALSERAAVVVTDEFPCFMLPRMVDAGSMQISARMETVDGNGILPLRATGGRVFPTACAFRRFLQKTLPDHLEASPQPDPLHGAGGVPSRPALPKTIVRRWPPVSFAKSPDEIIALLALDSSVLPAARRGGAREASRLLKRFISYSLDGYGTGRTDLEQPSVSGLSPYLHFGNISAHEVFAAVAKASAWTIDRLAKTAHGHKAGWWGMDPQAEAFLDQLITWRELGYNMAFHRPDYDRFESLPFWAQQTLSDHAKDKRPHRYTMSQFESAATHDPLWNAAQRQLITEGTIHNYLRMLWGKKILEWSRSPQDALAAMIELNNKYALDGRDPNSYSGIFWVLGRYDRPWGPERPIYGRIRYMSSDNTARKMRTQGYLKRYGPSEDDQET